MRVIPQPESGAMRPDAAPPRVNGPAPIRFVREAIRNSPWIVIAATAHIVALTTLSVIYVRSHDPKPVETGAVVKPVDRKTADETEVAADPVESQRNAVPEPKDPMVDGAPTHESDLIIPDAKPGVPGEDALDPKPDRMAGDENPDPNARPDLPPGPLGATSLGMNGPGHRGKEVSPWAGRRLGGGGIGGGGFGDNGGFGPTSGRKPDPRSGVLDALKWLKNHQSPDGRWDCDGFDAGCKLNRCDGAGEATHDVGVTGLSLLAFLGAGETHQSGTCRDTVKTALKYLRDVQDSEGCFGSRTSQHFLYDHACASLAMTEAYGMTSARLFKEPAQRGVGFVLRSRNPYLAWRYNVPADGDNDTSVTGWMVMALKSAKLSGLDVEKQPIEDALVWVERMTEPEFGRTGYQQRGGPPARTNEALAKFPNSKSESLTAVGLTCRIFGGRDTKSDPMIDKGADLLAKCLPKWDVDQGTIDFYYWYYGSLAMFQVGGPRWQKWNEAVKTALLDHQRKEKDRCEFGSWDPQDPWAPEGGRVYATAINCLTMEVYYRYPTLGVKSDK